MFNITNKKINTSMISNARRIISSLTLNANESKNKINNKQLKYDTDTDADTYDYNNMNMNDITNYMKQNKNKKYAFVLCGVGDFICIDYFLNFKDIHFIFVSKSSLLLKTLLMKTEKNYKSHVQHFAVYFNFDILNRPGFNDVNEMFQRLPYLKLLNKISQIHVVDINLFKHIRQNIINCNPKIEALNKNNRFLKTTYCDLKKFNLPDNIILICPYTQDNRVQCILCDKMHTETNNCIVTRNFTIKDYYNTESILKSQDVHRARILNEAMELKEQALMNFEASKKRKMTTMSDRGESVTITESAGESSFLTVARNCLEQQAKVLGLYDIKPEVEEKKSYKGFLDDLAKTIGDVNEKTANAKAIDATFKVAEDDNAPETSEGLSVISM